ncbi:MAG: geranylgeranylglyceryl/heptaprenylglyceryl phosphate synthase [Bacteroidales bacterium]|nr:geranylgeranylglyceryl/heptaprenylglyceryl phosphate synthase [Bacteroidales bacterium]
MNELYNRLTRKKGFAVLVDPDKNDAESLSRLCSLFVAHPPDLILVGGSLLLRPVTDTIVLLKACCVVPVYLFPGDVTQLSDAADGILLLSLISGRNPDFLIGNHVIAAPHLRRSGIEIIPTGYMLIENGHSTSVEYVSNTRPIPAGKTDIAVATAMAGEMLGLKVLYLEAGSGAAHTVGIDMISAIRGAVDLPMVVGGGIRSVGDAEMVYGAGANMIVIGTQLEEFPGQIAEFARLRDRLNE